MPYPVTYLLPGFPGVLPQGGTRHYPAAYVVAGLARLQPVTPVIDEPFEVSLCTYLNSKLSVKTYPNHVPQKVSLPGYTYECLDEDPYYLLSGERVGITSAIYQIDCLSTSSAGCVGLQVALRDALHGFHNAMMGNTLVQVARLQNRSSTHYEPSPSGSDKGTYTISCQYKFLYRDPIAPN